MNKIDLQEHISIYEHKEDMIIHSIAVILMYVIAVVVILKSTSLNFDADLWWHLRTGEWIINNKSVPVRDPFSFSGTREWLAYSWVYEILIYFMHRLLGLRAFVLYTLAMWMMIIWSLYSLLRFILQRTAISAVLTVLGFFAMGSFLTPRSLLFSILLFICELNILYRARSGNLRMLLFLPPLFVIWANTHIQFVYGLPVFFAALIESAFNYLRFKSQSQGSHKQLLRWLTSAFVISLFCTCITPYHIKIYAYLLEIFSQPVFYKYISELQSLSFRNLMSWLTLFIALSAAFFCGRRKELDLFPALSFGVAILVSFRSSRDAWLVVLIGLAIIASGLYSHEKKESSSPIQVFVPVCIILLLSILWPAIGASEHSLEERFAKEYPVAAAQFVEEKGYVGPLYNDFNWGGYLLWRLPGIPVSMDGRGYPYGGERFERSVKTWSKAEDWQDDQDLLSANLIIANKKFPMTAILVMDKRFECVYQDDLASVFVPRRF